MSIRTTLPARLVAERVSELIQPLASLRELRGFLEEGFLEEGAPLEGGVVAGVVVEEVVVAGVVVEEVVVEEVVIEEVMVEAPPLEGGRGGRRGRRGGEVTILKGLYFFLAGRGFLIK